MPSSVELGHLPMMPELSGHCRCSLLQAPFALEAHVLPSALPLGTAHLPADGVDPNRQIRWRFEVRLIRRLQQQRHGLGQGHVLHLDPLRTIIPVLVLGVPSVISRRWLASAPLPPLVRLLVGAILHSHGAVHLLTGLHTSCISGGHPLTPAPRWQACSWSLRDGSCCWWCCCCCRPIRFRPPLYRWG